MKLKTGRREKFTLYTGGDNVQKAEKDEKILAALLANPTTKAAAAACGISETQIYERLRDTEFKNRYDSARCEMLEASAAALQKHIGAAIEEMAKIATDKDTPAQTRLNACEAVIRSSLKLTDQVEILRRIEKLEKSMND